jgi:hypothetical protein
VTDYVFEEVLVYDRLGGVLQLARNAKVTVTDPDTGAVAPSLKVDGQPVSWVTSDANGQASWTSTLGRVRMTAPNGLSVIVRSNQYLDEIQAAPASAAASAASAASSASSAAASAALVGAPAGSAIDAYIGSGSSVAARKGDVVFNVKDYGAVGDGTTTNQHVAINNVFVPAGTYLIDASAGIKLNQAGTKLLLDQGATIKVQTNALDAYIALEVTAADCVVEGGTFFGDVDTHTGTTGEWGHLIVAQGGAHRLRIRGVKVTKAWGDGIAIQGNPADVSVIDVVADDNRRQGMSIIQATRPRVTGGVYRNTGLTKSTAPTAGIDVEPNAGVSVTDCVISGVTFTGNKGPGLQVATASGSTAEVTVTGCRSVGSTTQAGFYLVGPADTIKAKLTACHSLSNALHGFMVNANKTELSACTARSNTQYGFELNETDCVFVDPVAVENGRHGIHIGTATNTRIVGGVTRANSQTTSGAYINVDNVGTGTTIIGHVSDAGTLTNKPNWGFVIRTSSTARLIGCEAIGTYVSTALLDQPGNTPMFPKPGVAKQTLAAAATDAATTQTLANSLRTALINLGYGA